MHGFLKRKDRNAKAGLLDEEALDGVDAVGVRRARAPAGAANRLRPVPICRPKMPCE